MHILERVEAYSQEMKQTPYVYKIQKLGIEIFRYYIASNGLDIREEDFHKELLDKLVLIWLPKNKKYLSDAEIYQIIYTIHDIFSYIQNQLPKEQMVDEEEPTLLQAYGEEYMRVYKARNLLQRITKDPVISVDPIVIDFNRYKYRKEKKSCAEIATTYEQALFEVQECKEGGQVILSKLNQGKQYKLLMEYPAYKYMKKGDIIHAILKKKLFYVYWELEEIRAYYLPQAIELLSIN